MYLRLFLVIYWFLCVYVVLRKDWWVLMGWSSCRWEQGRGWRGEIGGRN